MLTREALEKAGRLHTKVADKFTKMNLNGGHRIMRGHQNSVTSIALSSDDRTAHSASKDGSIIQWDLETGKKVHTYRRCTDSAEGSTEEVLAIAVNTDGNLLASGGRDKFLRVYDIRSNKLLETFKGHKDPISCMAFRRNTNTLYTGSFDRSVKIWNLNEMAYVESLYGHQSNINGVDSYLKEVCTSVGSDRTVRSWQIVQETHLVFRPHNEVRSIDCVKMINEDNFVTGGEDGSISLWSTTKKKPIFTELAAHGPNHFISSLASLYSTDVIASGSGDGKVRIWKADTASRSISQVASADVNGFVNGLAFAKSGKFLLAGVGQEHRLGRWWKNQPARNGIHFIPIPLDLTL
jgi:ribosomal RNA-processing protein 9